MCVPVVCLQQASHSVPEQELLSDRGSAVIPAQQHQSGHGVRACGVCVCVRVVCVCVCVWGDTY